MHVCQSHSGIAVALEGLRGTLEHVATTLTHHIDDAGPKGHATNERLQSLESKVGKIETGQLELAKIVGEHITDDRVERAKGNRWVGIVVAVITAAGVVAQHYVK
jgi:hypothetical protein